MADDIGYDEGKLWIGLDGDLVADIIRGKEGLRRPRSPKSLRDFARKYAPTIFRQFKAMARELSKEEGKTVHVQFRSAKEVEEWLPGWYEGQG